MADAALILGQSLWRLRVLCTRIEDRTAPHLLGDAIRNSVFVTGFKVRVVAHPHFSIKS